MSTAHAAGLTTPAHPPAPPIALDSGWQLWRRQLFAIFRLEARKSFFTPRAVLLYLLAAMPVLIVGAGAILMVTLGKEQEPRNVVEVFSVLFQIFYLRGVIFFGCMWAFTNLFRGEFLGQSLHYYFLSPVRRWVLVVGKYMAGLLTTTTLFLTGVTATYLLLYLPTGWTATRSHLFDGPGLGHLFAYLGITLLACIGYGAVFLLFGLLFRNPIIPVAAVLIWELMNFLLPPLLKKISVIHYLNSMMPVPMSEGPFAIVTEPTPVVISILGLLAVSAVLLTLAALKLNKTEVSYGQD
jgi:ABC-type transport system involved in multi-copper enzyme maturation permease subunit